MRTTRRILTAVGLIAPLVALAPVASVEALSPPGAAVFISEFHYDNDGTDEGEAIEVFGPAGTDLTGWSIVRYNGSNGTVYTSPAETTPLPTAIPDLAGGYGVVTVEYPANGLQNGSPDGFALVDGAGALVQFLSYEGSFAGVGGPADGVTSTDVGVSEAGSTPIGQSLQLAGVGSCNGALAWTGPAANTFGSIGAITPDDTVECDGGGGGPEIPAVRFNELHYDNVGTDANEAIEIVGPAGTDLTGWTVTLYNGNAVIDNAYGTTVLAGAIPDLGGGTGVVVVDYPVNGIQNGGSDGFALADAAGALVEFLSYEGTLTASGGSADGETSTDIGVAEGSATLADQSLQRDDAGAWAGPACNSFGDLNVASPDEFCPLPPTEVKIHEIQGETDTSPLVGVRVIVEGIVVGDYEGPSPALRGFMVQEEDLDADANPLTSEGVFVFNFNDDDVNVGDLVRVEGTVAEFQRDPTDLTSTQLTDFVDVTVLATGQTLPTAATIEFPVVSFESLEAYEGMLATFPQQLVISEYFNYDRFGEVVVALPADGQTRPMTPTAVYDEDSAEAAALADLNSRSRITIDDGITSQNPSAPVHPITRDLFSLDNAFRGGDTVSGLTGPVHFDFDLYRVLPYAAGEAALPGYATYDQTVAPAAPDDVGGDLKVASLNALNYFLTLDDGVNDICGPNLDQECRGADADQGDDPGEPNEFDRQRTKLLNTLEGLDADVIGLNEMENTTGVEPLADLAAGLNDRLGAGTYDYVVAGTDGAVGTDAIKVGLLYRPSAVTPLGAAAVLDTPEFLDPNDTGQDKNRAAVAQTFVENASGEVFSVVVNHLKSKGSGCGAGDDHPLAGSCNVTRTLAAQALADWIDTDPTGVADDDWLIIGDLNSYDQEDPISALQAAGYTDLVGAFQGEFAYSYDFDGQFGYLDYLMSSASMTAQVTGATEWHINADEPDIFDYDTSFKSDYQDGLFDPSTPFRSSDHDAAVLGLSLTGVDAHVIALPKVLWPPNHKLRTVWLFAYNPNGLVDLTITDVVSSEADSGLGGGDRPNDIEVVRDSVVKLRAERFSRDGRTYTISYQLEAGGQVTFDTVDIVVPHSIRHGWGRWF